MSRKIKIPNLRRACIGFPEDELETIDELAEEQDTTRSELIRSAVSKVLPHKNREPAEPTIPFDNEPEEIADIPPTGDEREY